MSLLGRPPNAAVGARRAIACSVPCRWRKSQKPIGSKLPSDFTERRSSSGTKPSMPCGIPALASNFYASSWCGIPVAAATTIASSRSTSPSPPQMMSFFHRRWPLEVCFRDVKQFLGFEDPQNRVAQATTRTAPLIFYIYDLVLLWYAQVGYRLTANSVLDRLWYPQKASISFEDILRTLRHATWQERIFSDPTLDAHTRKLLQPFVEWAKALA